MANSHSPQHAQTKPVLWLIEHVAREMDVACAVRAIARYRYGLEIKIKHIYRDIRTLIEQESPAVVALPFFYNASDLAIKEYVEAWPNAVFFNLAWEEIFYKGHTKIKAPSDEFSRTRVLHNAWGNFYADYLTGNGVQPENIFVNGNPAYQLYLAPYCRYYQDRSALARKHNLDAARRWVLIPENYRWAFITDSTINWRVSQGADRTELAGMREYAQRCLTMLLRWANKAAEQKELEIIFRPKPVTQAKEMVDFFAANVGTEIHSRMHLIKGESVREWVLASDLVLSSFSTTLIEAAVACKPLAMVEPLPVTEAFDADWYQYLDRVRTEEEFIGKCLSTDSGSHAALKSWAEREMLAQGDAISRLADFTAHLAQNHTASNTIDRPKIVLPPDKIYFNERTHENDRFSDRETEDKTKRWTKVLAQPAMPVTFDEQTASPPGDTPNTAPEIRLSLIVCTYNSGPFIAKCLESIAAQDYQGSDVEVIVVDNNCTDGTPEVLKQFRTRLSNFDTVREYKQGLSNARNCGFRQARGQYLAYIDDDAALPPHYVGTLISLLKEHEPDFAGGPVYPYYTTEKPAWFHDDFEVRKQAEETGWAPGASISGGNFIIRRELLGELGL
ncbi:MAG TPA: glycosyltransferase, partial [Oligoflexia bacterium]|nr:glycosyltransferase [Oligoflexia bacterium]